MSRVFGRDFDAQDGNDLVLDQLVDSLDEFGEFRLRVDFVRAHELNHVEHTVHDFVLVRSHVAVAQETVDELLHQFQVLNRRVFRVQVFRLVHRRLLQRVDRLVDVLVRLFVEDQVLDQRDLDRLDVLGDLHAVDEVVVHDLELVDVLEQLDRLVVAVEAQVAHQVDRRLHPLELLRLHDASVLVDDDLALAVHLDVFGLREELLEHLLVRLVFGEQFDDLVLLALDCLALAHAQTREQVDVLDLVFGVDQVADQLLVDVLVEQPLVELDQTRERLFGQDAVLVVAFERLVDLQPDPLRGLDFVAHLAYERVSDYHLRDFLDLVQEAHLADVVVVEAVFVHLVRLLHNVDHDVEESDVARDFLVRGLALLLGGALDLVEVALRPGQELVHVREEVLQFVAELRDHFRRARLDLIDLPQDDRQGRVHAFERVCVQRVHLLDLERVVVRVGLGQQDGALLEELHVVLDLVVETLVAVFGLERVVLVLVLALHDLLAAEAHPDFLADAARAAHLEELELDVGVDAHVGQGLARGRVDEEDGVLVPLLAVVLVVRVFLVLVVSALEHLGQPQDALLLVGLLLVLEDDVDLGHAHLAARVHVFQPELVRLVLADRLLGDLAVEEGARLLADAVALLEHEEHAGVEVLLGLGALVDAQLAGLVALVELLEVAGVDVGGELALERGVLDHEHVAAVQHGRVLVLEAGALQDRDPLDLLGRGVHFLEVELGLLVGAAVGRLLVDARQLRVLGAVLLARDVLGAVELVAVVVVLEYDALALAHVVPLLLVVDARQDVPDGLERAGLHEADHEAALVLVRALRLLAAQEVGRVVVDQLHQVALLDRRLVLHARERAVQLLLHLGALLLQLDFGVELVQQ